MQAKGSLVVQAQGRLVVEAQGRLVVGAQGGRVQWVLNGVLRADSRILALS